MYTCKSILVQTWCHPRLTDYSFSITCCVSSRCHPSHKHIHTRFYCLNTCVFNLTGVCWTVCCLTYTTCSTVHIHSFHKKYIFVYTAFTIYNRAVAGTSGWMDVFVTNDLQCPQSTRNPLIIQHSHHNVSCIHISACPPAAWSSLIGLFGHQSPFDSPLQLPVHPFCQRSRPRCVTHTIGLMALLQEAEPFLLSYTVITAASVTSPLSCLFPANVHSTECHHNPPRNTWRTERWLYTGSF